MMGRSALFTAALLCACAAAAGAQASVNVQPVHLQGPRELAEQTQQGVVRDYLEAWKTLQTALQQNQAGLLDKDFVGIAKEKLTDTINEQASAGIRTVYEDRSHDLQFAFYSPEGLSIQLIDTVDYDMKIIRDGKEIASQPVHARYIVVMTPAEVRWRVRIFQAQEQ